MKTLIRKRVAERIAKRLSQKMPDVGHEIFIGGFTKVVAPRNGRTPMRWVVDHAYALPSEGIKKEKNSCWRVHLRTFQPYWQKLTVDGFTGEIVGAPEGDWFNRRRWSNLPA